MRALDTGAEGPGFLRTVHGFGYAFGADAAEEEPKRRTERASAQIEWERGVLPLREGENLIGRSEEVAVRIDVEGVSRCHARIVADGGRFTLEALDRRLSLLASLMRGSASAPLRPLARNAGCSTGSSRSPGLTARSRG